LGSLNFLTGCVHRAISSGPAKSHFFFLAKVVFLSLPLDGTAASFLPGCESISVFPDLVF